MMSLIGRKGQLGAPRKRKFSHRPCAAGAAPGVGGPLAAPPPRKPRNGALRGEGGARKWGDPWRHPGKSSVWNRGSEVPPTVALRDFLSGFTRRAHVCG